MMLKMMNPFGSVTGKIKKSIIAFGMQLTKSLKRLEQSINYEATVCENEKNVFSDSIPGVGGGNKEEDEISKEEQVW